MSTKRVGQVSTEWMEATRQKYGRAPVNVTAAPLPGHEDDKIEPLPDFYGMKEIPFAQLALNRADFRSRLMPRIPRRLRKLTWTSDRRSSSFRAEKKKP